MLLRTNFSIHIILREERQYWRKQVHVNVTLPDDSLVILRVFSRRLSGLLKTPKKPLENLTSSITLSWLKISFSSFKMNYLTVEKFFPWVAPIWNLSHPQFSETHCGEFHSLPRIYSYNLRKTKRDLMTNLQWSKIPEIFYSFYFYISLK